MARYRRTGAYRRRRNHRLRLAVAAAGTVLTVTAAIVAALILNRSTDNVAERASAATLKPIPIQTVAPVQSEAPAQTLAATETPAQTEAPASTPEADKTPAPVIVASGGYVDELPQPICEGFLPIFSKGKTSQKVIAITVDDFYQFDNARKIIDLAIANGAKLTIFPIGQNVLRDGLRDTIVYAYENGMEIENHTFEHEGLYRMNDEKMAKQIYQQTKAVNYVLGVDYQQHFFRPKGGDGRDDQRTHAYIKQLGMYGIAHWSALGNVPLDELMDSLSPGQIYLFHTTDTDLERLSEFIPAAVKAGYKLVTLNEMFGFPQNEVRELTGAAEEYEVPQLCEFELVNRVYKEGDYLWQVNIIQQRLVELGYLDDKPDGIFGPSTVKAITEFQKRNGLKPNGRANQKTQEALFSDAAKPKK